MTTYLIDTENVMTQWLDVVKQLSSDDVVVMFYSTNARAIPFYFLEKLLNAGVKLETSACDTVLTTETAALKTVSNAMDNCLMTELGYRIHANPDTKFIIVSADMDYDIVVIYWRKRGVDINRVTPASMAKSYAAAAEANRNKLGRPAAPTAPTTTVKREINTNHSEIKHETVTEQTANTDETADSDEKPVTEAPQGAQTTPEQTLSKTDCIANYRERLRDAKMPWIQAEQTATIIANALTLPANKRKINVYNAMMTAFGRQAGSIYYTRSESCIADILRNGPFIAAS